MLGPELLLRTLENFIYRILLNSTRVCIYDRV